MKITVYIKPHCNWCTDVLETLTRFKLPFEVIDIEAQPTTSATLLKLFGTQSVPCVQINDLCLSDTTGEEVAHYIIAHHLAKLPLTDTVLQKKDKSKMEELLHRRVARANTQRFF